MDIPFDHLYLCTTCFRLTSKGGTTQRCYCEPERTINALKKCIELEGIDSPNGFHLCYICAIRVAGGTSRWSHEACAFCVAANKSLAREKIRLPLGRHSIMNGFAIPIEIPEARFDEAAKNLIGMINTISLIEEIGHRKTIAMHQSQNHWHNLRAIPVLQWEAQFALNDKAEAKRSKKTIRAVVANLKGEC